MPRIKVPRKSTAIDMTAMCDVAFLLLTFFILTATARQPEPLPVDTPTSTTKFKQPTTDIATLTIGGKGKVFFNVAGPNIRMRTLELMGERYGVAFADDDKKRFSLIETFGVDVSNLKKVIDMNNADRNKEGLQPGIPLDSVGTNPSELYNWVHNARIATKELNGTSLRFSIKGDSKEEYPTIKKVIDILQSDQVNKFSLITALEAAD
jgi:biopolymer transport protein ExbD